MDKQYFVLMDHKEHNISWQKGHVIMLDPTTAIPHIGIHLVPLYSAIKTGLYKPSDTPKPLLTQIIEAVSPTPSPGATDQVPQKPSSKKILQNKLQEQILAKKAELAKNKNNS